MQNQPIDEHAFYLGVQALLILTALVASAASLLHYLEPEPELLDLVVPPLAALVNIALALWLMRRPVHILLVIYGAFLTAIVALALPAWFYSVRAFRTPGELLINTMPPTSSLMIALVVLVMVMLPVRRAFPIMLFAWAVNAVPIVGYLLMHSAELWTARGQEMFMSYGLVILLLLVLLPFQHRARVQLQRLQDDNSQMHNLAERDALTQQYNRWGGQKLLDAFMQSKAPGSVIMLDIDHFKAINDTHGHMVGDRVLQTFGARINNALRSDGHVIRWGGEEFLVLICGIGERDALTIAERLRSAINTEPFAPVGRLTVSSGVAVRAKNDTLESLIARADQALYQAKLQGRDQVVSSFPTN